MCSSPTAPPAAQLVVLTDKGRRAFAAALAAYNPKVNALAEELPFEGIRAAQRIVVALRDRLQGENDAEKHD